MAWLMNDQDMDDMLKKICPAEESYQGKAWGTLMSGTAAMLALGALSNVSCYVGVTEKTLVLRLLISSSKRSNSPFIRALVSSS